MAISFVDWNESIGCCGPFTYSASLNDSSQTYIQFHKTSRTFKAYAADGNSAAGVYLITVNGSLGSGQSSTVNFTITIF